MPDPILTDDLYGPSNPPVPEGTPSIPIEETPEIPVEQPTTAAPAPIPMPAPAPAPRVQQPPPRPEADQPLADKTSFSSTLGTLLLFAGLFVLGVLLSSVIRQYFSSGLSGGTTEQETVSELIPTPIPTVTDPLAGWKTYQVINGTTKLPIEELSYKLPPDILSPICDATACMSQGTYLPGGTRLTIAVRGVGQPLADFRGSVISDMTGAMFTSQDTTVSGYNAKLFTGNFSGRTVAGYGFSQMRGYMIEVTPTLSLEINHFTPTGITADFAADDILFDQIVGTFVFSGSTVPLATATPVPATTSGY